MLFCVPLQKMFIEFFSVNQHNEELHHHKDQWKAKIVTETDLKHFPQIHSNTWVGNDTKEILKTTNWPCLKKVKKWVNKNKERSMQLFFPGNWVIYYKYALMKEDRMIESGYQLLDSSHTEGLSPQRTHIQMFSTLLQRPMFLTSVKETGTFWGI